MNLERGSRESRESITAKKIGMKLAGFMVGGTLFYCGLEALVEDKVPDGLLLLSLGIGFLVISGVKRFRSKNQT